MKSKRLLALLLSVMLIMGAVMSVPFTASAKNAELSETGAYSLRFDSFKLNGQHIQLDKDYFCMYDPKAVESTPLYAVLDTDKAGYYVLYAKNCSLTTGDNTVTIGVVDEKESLDHSMGLADGEESELAVRLEANTRYYIKLCYNYEQDSYGNLDLKLSYFADAEPDEMKPDIKVNAGEAYEGSIDVSEDKDWIFVQVANDKKHSITLENLNEEPTFFIAEIYDTKNSLLGTVTTENEDLVTLELAKPAEVVSYYICVKGNNTNVRGEYLVKMEEVAPKSVEIPLNEDYYDAITGFGTEGGHDYLKFTTIDKDAYYTITVKNINITTHSWADDNEVQADILNAYDERLGNINLTEDQEKSITLKLQPNTTYYIRVYNNYLPDTKGGNYKINISYVLDPEPNVMENGKILRIAERYYGSIAASGDMDFFKITTGEKTDYILYLKNINIPTHSWSGDHQFRVVLYNKYSESLGEILATNGNEGNINITLEPNTTYYLGVWDPDGTTGDYNVILSDGMLLGDVNSDSAVKIQDATLIQKSLAKLAELDSKQTAAADVTEDGKVNIKDATAIQKFIAKIETPYKTGQLILAEIKYDEPATEATEPAESTDATEVTRATEPTETQTFTEVTEPTEATAENTEPTETTSFQEVTEPTEATTEITEPLSQLDTLKALNDEVSDYLDAHKEYADEAPLKESSEEIALKKELGFYDRAGEQSINEYEKLFRTNDRITYYLMHGYQYVNDHSEYIDMLTNDFTWFKYYVENVHPQPSGKVIYFEDALDWGEIYVYAWNSQNGESNALWPGKKMLEYNRGTVENLYYIEIPTGYDAVVFSSGIYLDAHSDEINLLEHTDTNGFRMTYDNVNGLGYEVFNYEEPRPDL